MRGSSLNFSCQLLQSAVRCRQAYWICGPVPRCRSSSEQDRVRQVNWSPGSSHIVTPSTPFLSLRRTRGRVSHVVCAEEDLEDRIQPDLTTQQPRKPPKPPKGEQPWWDLTRYTAQERALLLGITLGLLLFGPRLVIFLIAFLERGVVAAGLVVEAALVEIFLATFRWLALGAGLLIIGGIFYFLQLERERLDKQ